MIETRERTMHMLGRTGLVLVVFFILEWSFFQLGRLAPDAYRSTSIAAEIAQGMFSFQNGPFRATAVLGLIAILVAAFVQRRHSVFAPWSDLTEYPGVRVFVSVVAAVLAWAYTTYAYNLYVDQGHLADRLLLLVLVGLVVWRPVFVLPFTVLTIAIVTQFEQPIRPYSVAEQFALVRMLILFSATYLIWLIGRKHTAAEFVFWVIVLLAGSYLKCGVGKILLGRPDHPFLNWVGYGDIFTILFASHAAGWLSSLAPETVTSIASRIAPFDVCLVAGTIVLECGALFVLWGRRTLRLFLIGWVVFHVSVFALSGICFWKWIIVDMTLLVLFTASHRLAGMPRFTRQQFYLSVPLMIGGLSWFNPVSLAWYDSPVAYACRFEGIGASGTRYALPPSTFAPFDYCFSLSTFNYLSRDPGLLLGGGGLWDRDVADALRDARSLADVEAIERAFGQVPYSDFRAKHLDEFLVRVLGKYGERGERSAFARVVAAPPQIWRDEPEPSYAGQEPLTDVIVTQITTLFDGEAYGRIRERVVRRVPLVPVDGG